MKLKSLTINGFKSFADKTEIDFQPGITGIVGPNGSGKSNIIEALRWVLGEQSAKNLRGSKMPDVIFAGSASRAPLNRAEVSIEFDNSDRFLADQPDELQITRRIYRSGESEFLINNKKVRLKDIVNLFMDTGLGKESFSVISQGRVESIFNSKPEDRRVLIEETAGILKYKKEKERAQKELDETTDHLDRVVDILTELKRQKEPLEEQASIAKDYLEQKKQFDYYELNRLVLEIQQGQTEKAEIDSELTQTKALLEKYQVEAEKQEQATQKLHQQQKAVEEELDSSQEQLVTLTEQKERLVGRKDVSEQQQKFQQERQTELTVQRDNNQTELKELKKRLQEQTRKADELTQRKQEINEQIQELKVNQKMDPTEFENEIQRLKQQLNEKIQYKMQLESELNFLEEHFNQNREQLNQLEKERTNFVEQLDAANNKTKLCKQDLSALKHQVEEIEHQSNQTQARQNELQHKLNVQRQNWYQASEIIQKAKARYEALHSVESNYSGYYAGVREILRQRKKFAGVVGSVAETINVDQKYSLAIETALGSQLQNVIVSDQQTAKECIRYLTQKRLGRATFLPQSTMKGRVLNSQIVRQAENVPGFIGIASKLVSTKRDNQEIIDYLLGTTLVATDLDSATSLANQINHRAKVISLTGDVINPGGSMTGGKNRNQQNGLLKKKQETETLKRQIETMQNKLADLEVDGQKINQEIETLNAENQNQTTKLNVVLQKRKAAQEKVDDCNFEIKRLKNELASVENEIAKITGKEDRAQKAKNQDQLATLKAEIDKLNLQLEQKQSISQNQRDVEQANKQKLVGLQQEQMQITEELTTVKIHQKENQTQIQQLQRAMQQINRQLTDLENQKSESQLHGDELKAKAHEIEQQHASLNQAVQQLKVKRAKLHEELETAELQSRRANELQQAAYDDQRKLSLRTGKLAAELEQALNELADDYQLTFEKAQKQASEKNLNEVLRHLKLLKRGIDELGNVNLGAIDEFERVNERFEFLNTQQNDLVAAKETLIQSMNEMDSEVKQRFKTTFNQVSKAFSELFPQIFGGGKAYLSLTAPDDLLKTGIEITAQPPGKKAQRLSLLSGGERSLTAITLLFALLKVRPVPFAVLDEAEAALDDANVARYSQYLKHFDDETQFIVITHRKGTMMQADVLYGVTMQESGVSKMVSVALTDVI